MARRQIEKTVAVHLLDAAKGVLDHISKWTVELGTCGQETPKGLSQLYGSVRRLRDYLQRCFSSFAQPAEIDFSVEDENLLATCALHVIATIDQNAGKHSRTSPQDRALLEEKKRILVEWGVLFATKVPERVPVANKLEFNTPTVRSMLAAISKKVSMGVGPMAITRNAFNAPVVIGSTPNPAPVEQPATAAMDEDLWSQQALRRSEGAQDVTPQSAPPAPGASAKKIEEILDAQRIRDPRLRVIVGLDLRAFQRAMEANDHRVALVHLASVFEAGVIDCALSKRQELALQGTPEAWSLEAILTKVLAERFTIVDRGQLAHLISARTLIRPCVQLNAPFAVTPNTLLQMLAFVHHLFTELGLVGSGVPAPQPPKQDGLTPVGPSWSGIWSSLAHGGAAGAPPAYPGLS